MAQRGLGWCDIGPRVTRLPGPREHYTSCDLIHPWSGSSLSSESRSFYDSTQREGPTQVDREIETEVKERWKDVGEGERRRGRGRLRGRRRK